MTSSENPEPSSEINSHGFKHQALIDTYYPRQRPLFGQMLFAVAILIGIIAVLETFIVFRILTSDDYFRMLPDFLQTIFLKFHKGMLLVIMMLPVGLTIEVSRALIKRSRRHFVHVYEASEPHVFQAPILYLRPFGADEALAKTQVSFFPFNKRDLLWASLKAAGGVKRYEELLAFALGRMGTFVTIGDPKETLPLLGATRIYSAMSDSAENIDEETWKIEVEHQIADAQLILLHSGISEGLKWEVNRIVQLANPQHVILCIHPSRKLKWKPRDLKTLRAEIQELWTQFRSTFESTFPHGLPEFIDDARFIKFDPDWTPRPVQLTEQMIQWFVTSWTYKNLTTVDSALAWLTWMLVPEAYGQKLLTYFIDSMTSFIIFIVIVLFALMLAACRSSHQFRPQLGTAGQI